MSLRLTGAVFAVLCLSFSALAQDKCLSRPSIQQKLLPLIVPLDEMLTSVATGTDDTDEAMRRLNEALRLVRAWTTAPAGVDGCWRKVK